jgi:CubicO group peptidase (beta-lactamase class C family)
VLRRILIIAACVLAACAPASPATQADDARIARILNGLRPPLAISGEPAVRWTLAERMRRFHVPGVSIAVIDSGRIAWAQGFGVRQTGGSDSVTPTTVFQAASISKPTFALGVMHLVQDGTLNLDEDVNAKLTSWHLPENKFTVREKVTLRRILSHNAGLTVSGFPGYEAGSPIPTVPQILDGLPPANTPPVRVDTTPGAISRYSGGGVTIAMLLVTDVVHEPFPAFMQRMVLGPAGMTRSTYEQPLPVKWTGDAATAHDTGGVPIPGKYHTYPEMSAAGLWTTPSDLARLAIVVQRTYAGRDSTIVNPATVREMLTVQKEPFGIGYAVSGSGPTLEFEHSGGNEGFRDDFIAFAERGQGAVIMTNGDNGSNLIREIEGSLAAEYGWPDAQQVVRHAIPIDSATRAALAGTYRLSMPQRTLPATVVADSGKLYLAFNHRSDRVEVLADSNGTFFMRTNGTSITFARDAKGRATAMTLAGRFSGPRE